MKILRVLNPEISVQLIPWYVPDDKTPIEIGMELDQRMREDSDNTGVFVAVKNGYLKAMLIGYMEGETLFVWQARKSKDMDRPRLIFHELCRWAKAKGAKKAQLKSSDKRVRRMYKRKYGFTPLGGPLMERTI